MTCETLSKEFSTHYKTLESYTKGQIKQANKNIDYSIILSECYIHLDKYKETIETSNDILIFSKKFIRSNINWYNSVIFKETNKQKISDDIQYIVTSKATSFFNLEDDTVKNIMDSFYDTLNRYDKGLYHIYFVLNKYNITLIAEHLNISKSSAYRTLLECKNLEDNLKQYIKINTYTI